MPGRLDLRPLLKGLGDGLRLRRNSGEEPVDVFTRRALVVVPLGAGLLMGACRVQLTHADQVLAGSAVLIGALLGSFALVASWRERVLARNLPSDQSSLRALNEVAAHILVATLAAVLLVTACAALANIKLDSKHPALPGTILVIILSAIAVAVFTYLVLTLIIVVNLLWDAYLRAGSARSSL